MRWAFVFLLVTITFCGFSQTQNEKLAYQYYAEKQFEKATVLYEDLYKNEGKRDYYEPLLSSYLFLERYKEAQKLTKTHSKRHPEQPEFTIDLGYVYELWGKTKKAEETYEEVIKTMPPNVSTVIAIGNRFFQKKKYNLAVKTYNRGAKILNNDYPFSFELAKVYEAQGNLTAVTDALIGVIDFGDEYLDAVKGALTTFLNADDNGKKRAIVKEALLEKVHKNPNNIATTELLIWFFMQEKKFSSALIHAKALDKRLKEVGTRIDELAKSCIQNNDYNTAIKAYNYLLQKDKGSYYYRYARMQLVKVFNLKIKEDPNATYDDILALKSNYESVFKDLGKNNFTIDLVVGYSKLIAFNLNNTTAAKNELEAALQFPRVKAKEKAACKIVLADVYVKENEIWEAALLYGQVHQDFKEDVIGHEAKLKSAKAYFYAGEFNWAKTQLDVLKASTTKLIANDALQLSVLISDNLGMDTATAPLKLFAQADLFRYQNNDSLALFYCDSLLQTFPTNLTLLDDVYFLKGDIFYKKKLWKQAIDNYQKAVDYNDLLKDDALFKMGVIYETTLNDNAKAKACFEQIILNHQDSFFITEARKRYRAIRGN